MDETNEDSAPKSEKLAVAAEFLGYSNAHLSEEPWSENLMAEKRERMRQHAEFLRCFTDESRLEIVVFLMHSGGGQLKAYSVSEIAERFKISMSTVSHHLQELRRLNVVTMERSGKERYYQLNLDYIIERVGNWHERLLMKKQSLQNNTSNCLMPDNSTEDKAKASSLLPPVAPDPTRN